ncbi:MAG: DUF1828 domain-containing protein, partial [Chloroflexota bacterium]|nr:DUF1828 domain-containing protein [Chloroflexota bacterium]
MIEEIRQLTNEYHAWLRDNTTLVQGEEWIEITTPFLDRHNDHLQIYAEPADGGYLLSDDGYIIADLAMSGCKLDSGRRKTLLNMTLNGFGVQLVNEEMQVRANAQNFARKKHNLLQAMLAVNDLFYLARPFTRSLFFEDVVVWLDDSNIRYLQNVKVSGKSGYDHHYNFVIAGNRQQPDRMLLSINNPDRVTATKAAFAWLDTREARQREARAYALLNDAAKPVSSAVVAALHNYDVRPI